MNIPDSVRNQVIDLVRERRRGGDTYAETKERVEESYGVVITRNFIYYHTKDLPKEGSGVEERKNSEDDEMRSFVRSCRRRGLTYPETQRGVERIFGESVTDNYIYYHTKDLVKNGEIGSEDGGVDRVEDPPASKGKSSVRVLGGSIVADIQPAATSGGNGKRIETDGGVTSACSVPAQIPAPEVEAGKAPNNIYEKIDEEVVRLRGQGKKYADIIQRVKEKYERTISRSFIYTRVKNAEGGDEEKSEAAGTRRKEPAHQEDFETCELCHGQLRADEARGEVTCTMCGLVARERRIDKGPEWRIFDDGDRSRVRTGSPRKVSIFDMGLSTDFYPYGKDARGSPLSAKNRASFKRWRRWNNRNKITDSDNRNFSKAFNELEKICSQLHIPSSAKEDAAMLYRKVRKHKLTTGCSINGMITACVYAVCRMRKRPKTQEELLECSQVSDLGELRTCYKRLLELGIDIPTTEPEDYIAKYRSELQLPQSVATNARKLLDLVNQTAIAVGRNPKGVAAAALYIVSRKSGIPKSQSDFSTVCGITDVTIRQRCSEITEAFNVAL
jgi:transcription initiation factor TFIIB